MGKFDRARNWLDMEAAQVPYYIPPPEELAGLPDIIQEQYQARATPTVSTQNQAYRDYTEIMHPPPQEWYGIGSPWGERHMHDDEAEQAQNSLYDHENLQISAQAEPGVFDPRSWAPELVDYLFGDKLSFSDVPIGGSYEEQVAFQNALAEQWASDVLDVAKYAGGLTGAVAGLVGDFRNTTGLWSDYFGGTGDLATALASSAGTIQRAEDILYPPPYDYMSSDDDVEPTIKIGDRVQLDDASAIVTKIDGDRIFVDVEDGYDAPNILEITKNDLGFSGTYETPLSHPSRWSRISTVGDKAVDSYVRRSRDFKTVDDLIAEWTSEPGWEKWEEKYFDYIDSWAGVGLHGIPSTNINFSADYYESAIPKPRNMQNRVYLHKDIMENIYDLTMKTAKPGEEISTFKQIIETIAARQDAEPDEFPPIIYKKVMRELSDPNNP